MVTPTSSTFTYNAYAGIGDGGFQQVGFTYADYSSMPTLAYNGEGVRSNNMAFGEGFPPGYGHAESWAQESQPGLIELYNHDSVEQTVELEYEWYWDVSSDEYTEDEFVEGTIEIWMSLADPWSQTFTGPWSWFEEGMETYQVMLPPGTPGDPSMRAVDLWSRVSGWVTIIPEPGTLLMLSVAGLLLHRR